MGLSDPFQIVGTTIAEKYRVDGTLGEGGYGVVYAGFHLLLKTPVAIKLLKPVSGAYASEQTATEQFLREARILFSLSHRAIVRMYDVGELATRLGNVPYVVLEKLDGIGLDAEIAARRQAGRGGLDASELLGVFVPVLEALAFAHRHGVVHRDLKPSNVMLVTEANGMRSAKVLDFGTARASAQEVSSGTTGFTPRYASPEQWDPSFGTTGPASDIFALGLILAEAATLEPAFPFTTPTQVIAAAVSASHVVRVRGKRPDLPDAFEQVVMRATARPMHERFGSTEEMLDALRAALSGVPAQAPSAMAAASMAMGGGAPMGGSPYAPMPPPVYTSQPRYDLTGPPMWTGPRPVTPQASSSGWILLVALGAFVLLGGVVGAGLLLGRAHSASPTETIEVTEPTESPIPTTTEEPTPTEDPKATKTPGTARTGRTPGATAHPIGTPSTTAPGTTSVASAAPTTAPVAAGGRIGLSLSRTHVAPGEHFDAHFSPALPAAGDRFWITVLPADSSDSTWGDWSYVSVGQSDQGLVAPNKPGTYEVRLHDQYPRYTTHVNNRVRFTVDGDVAH